MDREKFKAKVQTVSGLVDAEKLGITLTHEHFLIDMTALVHIPETPGEKALAYQPVTIENLSWVRYNMYSNLDNNRLLDEELAIGEAKLFKKAGGKTIVDVTNDNIGRDPAALVRISQATGLNVIMGSGYYVGEVQSR
ncbi:phosphotriesterase-related protein, partial [Chloroflexota bacterium]